MQAPPFLSLPQLAASKATGEVGFAYDPTDLWTEMQISVIWSLYTHLYKLSTGRKVHSVNTPVDPAPIRFLGGRARILIKSKSSLLLCLSQAQFQDHPANRRRLGDIASRKGNEGRRKIYFPFQKNLQLFSFCGNTSLVLDHLFGDAKDHSPKQRDCDIQVKFVRAIEPLFTTRVTGFLVGDI